MIISFFPPFNYLMVIDLKQRIIHPITTKKLSSSLIITVLQDDHNGKAWNGMEGRVWNGSKNKR